MKTFRGRFALEEIEFAAGDFTEVLMKPFESRVIRGPHGERPLTTVGYAWPCGCEARGTALNGWRTCFWSTCGRHTSFASSQPICDVPERLAGDYRVPLTSQGLQRGWEIFEAVPHIP